MKPVCVSVCAQAMRFPPKAYNKDLESAEVTATCVRETCTYVWCVTDGRWWNRFLCVDRREERENSRIWSLLKRWQKMMMTVFLKCAVSHLFIFMVLYLSQNRINVSSVSHIRLSCALSRRMNSWCFSLLMFLAWQNLIYSEYISSCVFFFY